MWFKKLGLIILLIWGARLSYAAEQFDMGIQPIPADVAAKMRGVTWHEGCPVALEDLAYLQLEYWGDDDVTHQGVLIVNKQLTHEVVLLFHELYQLHFPIHSMKPMYEFAGDDDASMAANNTSAFNCRQVTGQPGIYSQHSYGRAIDINPLWNPYVKSGKVLPPAGKAYVNRDEPLPGQITDTSQIYHLFKRRHWSWGGDWHDLQDYQHFEKRADGAHRDPEGYH